MRYKILIIALILSMAYLLIPKGDTVEQQAREIELQLISVRNALNE